MINAAQLIARIAIDGAAQSEMQLLNVGTAAESTGTKLSKLALGATLLAGAAFVGLGAVAVHMAADFQQGINRLITGAGDVTDNMTKMGQGILGVSVATGILTSGTDGLNAAMYLIISSGQRGAQALDTLTAAAQGAQIEQAKVVDVAQILSVMMTNFGRTTYTAAQYMDGLIAAVAHGQITLENLSTAMSPILPNAKELGIHFADVAAAMSEMTNKGIPAAQAATSLRFMMQSMILPTKASQTAMQEWGLDTAKVAAEMKISLPGALQMYIDAAKHAGKEGSQPFIDALANMMGGGQRAAKALFALSQGMGDWKTIIGDVNAGLKDTSVQVSGWDTAQTNLNQRLQEAWAAVQALFIGVGTQLLPAVTNLLIQVTPLIQAFTTWALSGHALNDVIVFFNQNTQTLVPILAGLSAILLAALIPAVYSLASGVIVATWPFLALGVAVGGLVAWLLQANPQITTISGAFEMLAPIIQNTALALAVFFLPAIIASGVEAVISAAKITYNFVASLIATGINGWAAAAKLAIFIASLVATGAQAVWAAGVIVFNLVAGMAATAVQAAITADVLAGKMVWGLAATATESGIVAAVMSGTLIPTLTAVGVAAWASLGPFALVAGAIVLLGTIVKATADTWDQGMGKIQNSTGKMAHGVLTDTQIAKIAAVQNANQMKDGVTSAADQTYQKVIKDFTAMKDQGLAQTSQLTWQASDMFAAMGNRVGIDMANMDANAKNYWNDVANYINMHPISGHVTFTTGGAPLMHNAGGTNFSPGGLSIVGEQGPELMYIPRGAQIIPNNRLGQVSSQGSGSASGQPVVINIHIAGQRVAQVLLPEIVSAVRQRTGVKF